MTNGMKKMSYGGQQKCTLYTEFHIPQAFSVVCTYEIRS